MKSKGLRQRLGLSPRADDSTSPTDHSRFASNSTHSDPETMDYSSPERSKGKARSERLDTLAATPTSNETSSETDSSIESISPGMHCGLKDLYGLEDKRGRYQWQDTIPDDIGSAAENEETAKYAILVRRVKAYNDATRVLAINSIVVQSPLLKKLLEVVLKDYPGVTPGLQRLEFGGKFEPIIHRWSKLRKAIDALGDKNEEDRITKEHSVLLYKLLKDEFDSLIENSQDMMAKKVMTYNLLWTLFQPGAIVYSRQDGQETALRLLETRYGQDSKQNPCFWLVCRFVDWDGTRFGMSKINLPILFYSGTRRVTQLPVYPIEYHHDSKALRKRLVERGAKAEALAGSHYKSYHGVAWKLSQYGTKDKYNIKGRVVIDTYGWNRFNPSQAIFVSPFSQKDNLQTLDYGSDDDQYQDSGDQEDEECYSEDGYDDGIPVDGQFPDEDDASNRPALTLEQKLICTPLLRGYSLKTKLWLNFFVNCVGEIEWQNGAFDRLVLPSNQKELILGYTESQRKYKTSFDDVIEGKGRGIILLLCGPPGVGKTLTAESVAEEMKVPLFMMSAGDLGLDPQGVETKLQNILEMCTKWNAILLLDEADVFLEQRSLHELERNKLVTIFLRVLEYYEGIMFLTTNRVNTFDPAFQSRIHISIDYQELSTESRRQVWKNFLDSSPLENTITDGQMRELSRLNMNGRQIKNVLKTAQLLARHKEAKLTYEHVTQTLECTQHLLNSVNDTERTRASIFC